jgi:hypothetical protein
MGQDNRQVPGLVRTRTDGAYRTDNSERKQMRFPEVHDAVTRMKLVRLKQPDDTYRETLVFRSHHTTDRTLHGKEVPSTQIQTNSVRPDYFFFCGEFVLQFTVYYSFFAQTKLQDDAEVRGFSMRDMDIDTVEKVNRLQAMSRREVPSVPAKVLVARRNECMSRMLNEGMSERDAETLFFVKFGYTADILNPNKTVLSKEAVKYKEHKDGGKKKHKDMIGDPRYKAISKMIVYARTKAYSSGIYGGFVIADIFPNMYSVHGNVGAHNGELFIPAICPVLRIPLMWEDNGSDYSNKRVGSPRVWRKTNTMPFGPDNVIIMSKLAAWLIEGSYALGGASRSLTPEMTQAWEEWQERHPFQKPTPAPRKAYKKRAIRGTD